MDGWHPRDLARLAIAAVKGWVADAAPSMGASLAFYTLFSLVPLLLVVIALAAPFLGDDAARQLLIAQITNYTGQKAAAGVSALLDAAAARETTGFARFLGPVTLLLGAMTVFAELQADMNRIWRTKPAGGGGVMRFIRSRLIAFSLVMTVGLLLLASVAATAWLAWIGRTWFPGAAALMRAGEFAISFVVVTGLFAVIYKLVPAIPVQWRDVWVGAAVTSVLFWIGKYLIGLYVARGTIASAFGAASAIVVVIAWVYYSAQVFFLGAEFTRQYALRHGSHHEEADAIHEAANDEALLDRARRIVRGADPLARPPRQA